MSEINLDDYILELAAAGLQVKSKALEENIKAAREFNYEIRNEVLEILRKKDNLYSLLAKQINERLRAKQELLRKKAIDVDALAAHLEEVRQAQMLKKND